MKILKTILIVNLTIILTILLLPLVKSNASSNIDQSSIVNTAYSKLGARYAFGGVGPDVFDTSGFTQYVYKQSGILIARTVYGQLDNGIEVTESELAPGDLVFTSAGHVGIYVGDGQMIHAPQTGDVVKVSKIWSFYAARRVILNKDYNEKFDFNKDGYVDIMDIAMLSEKYGYSNTNTDWNQIYDLNNDNTIDIYDLVLISKSMKD
ncbi:NlpC/P60 family protein [Clostridium intestinale]|uniref:NlpC/P60 family protein n=1 Tax=Clostridium intestinale TaxID=36845 RepID=UPI002DD64FD6|nr:NlpC/P60 family protein [Clostridium intestinale]WRY52636.1 NlpC/P60 family protein [Clostridium intestinale]